VLQIIVDEAHNLVDAISNMYGQTLTAWQLSHAKQAVQLYTDRFGSVLTGRNQYYVNVLASVISGMLQMLVPFTQDKSNITSADRAAEVFTPNELVFRLRLDNVNLVRLKRHMDTVHAAEKMGGHAEASQRRAHVQSGENTAFENVKINYIAALRAVLEFGGKLMNTDSTCRIV